MTTVLESKELMKSYKGKKAVDGVSFAVQKGEILCLLGPNGAGKSTTINMLIGALGQDSGEIRSVYSGGRDIHGDLRAYKGQLGIVPQDLALYEDLSAEQNVLFFASLYGMRGKELRRQCGWALSFAGLTERAKDKVKTFSGGMKRRLNIACAIAHRPGLVVMDEPTVGIDPQSRGHILQSIKRLREQGTTILYTTHYMEEVEEIASRIIVMDHGRVIAQGTAEELKAEYSSEVLTCIEADGLDGFDLDELYRVEGLLQARKSGGRLEVACIQGTQNLDRIIAALLEQGVVIHSIAARNVSLEAVFLSLTGRSLRD